MPKLQNNAVVGLDHPSSSILLIAKWFEPVHGLDRQFVIASVAFDSVALANEYVPAAGLRRKPDWTAVAVDASALWTVGG